MNRCLLLCILTSVAAAAVWTTNGRDLLEAETLPGLENVQVDPDGTVRLSAGTEVLAELEDNAAWRITLGPGRAWYAGTGSTGRLYTGTGRGATTAAEVEEGDILALLHDSRAGLLFGLTPGGTVYRLRPDGTVETRFTSEEDYIFDLLAGPGGEVYVATGSAGRLYRLPAQGGSELLFTAPQAHLTCLAWLEPGRTLLAGSSPDGLVYRLDLTPGGAEPEISVLYDSALDEIRALLVTRDPDGARIHIAANPSSEGDSGAGAVHCVRENGTPVWQWSAPDSELFALAADDDGLLVATGQDGLIYRLDRLGRPGIYLRLPVARVLCLARSADGLLAGTSDPAQVIRLTSGLAASGSVQSPVHDCEGPAGFGRITRRAQVPSGSELALDTRTGNSATPDETWSEWQAAPDIIRSRPARFIQWRARLSSGFPGRSPELERVDIHYAIPNRPPALRALELEEPELPEAARGETRPVRELGWTGLDPDRDSLGYTVDYRPEGHDRWLKLAEDITESSYRLDTRLLPDGWYRFRVRATDAPSRPRDEALEAEAVSPLYLFDNTPPRITGLRLDGGRLRLTATDALSAISAARVSVNAGAWQPLAPDDGLYDSPEENLSVALDLRPGMNHIAVWVADAQGNSTTAALTAGR